MDVQCEKCQGYCQGSCQPKITRIVTLCRDCGRGYLGTEHNCPAKTEVREMSNWSERTCDRCLVSKEYTTIVALQQFANPKRKTLSYVICRECIASIAERFESTEVPTNV